MKFKYRLPLWFRAVLFSLAYYFCAKLGQYLTFDGNSAATFWPPSGLYVAVLLLSQPSEWPVFLMAAIPANVSFDLLQGRTLWLSLVFTCGNSLEALAGAWLVRAFTKNDFKLSKPRDWMLLGILSATLSTMISATIGAAVITLPFRITPYFTNWATWWSGDVVGVLIFTPVIIAWTQAGFRGRWHSAWRMAEYGLLAVVLAICGWIILLLPVESVLSRSYLIIPVLIWIAMRFDLRTLTTVQVGLGILAVWGAIHGVGIFASTSLSVWEQISSLQLFIGLNAFVILLLSNIWSDRNRSEATTRDLARKYRIVADNTYDWEYWIDPQGSFLYCSPSCERVTGYTEDAFYTDPKLLLRIIDPEDKNIFFQHWEKEHHAQSAETIEFRIVHKDGTTRWMNHACQLVFDEQSVYMGIRASNRDVTRRKQAEFVLHEKDQNLQTLFNTMTEGVALNEAIYNDQGNIVDYRILEVNKAFYTVADYRGDKVIGKLATQIFGLTTTYIQAFWKILMERKVTTYTELKSPLSDKYYFIATSPLVENKFVTTFIDITPRKRTEQELRESEALLNRSQEIAGMGSFVLNIKENSVTWSRNMYILHGIEPGEADYNLWELSRQMIHPNDREWVDVDIQTMFSTGQVKDMEFRIVRADGAERVMKSTGNFDLDESRRPIRYVGIYRDITEEHRTRFERETNLALLHILTEHNGATELIHNLTAFIHNWTGIDAVGIRLCDGNDAPYFVTQGFPAEFLQAEPFLCTSDLEGQRLPDCTGVPTLENMGGNFQCWRTNSEKSFFTPHGSFWVNSISELLSSAPEENRETLTCNRFWREGYESVALIPLRHGQQAIGLLKLIDHLQGRFTPELVAFLESQCDQIAIALNQRQTQRALQLSEERYRSLFENASIPMWEEDYSLVKTKLDQLRADGIINLRNYFDEHPDQVAQCANLVKVLDINQETLRFFKVAQKELLPRNLTDFFVEESWSVFKNEVVALAEGETRLEHELPFRSLEGDIKINLVHLAVAPGYEDSLGKVLVSFMDITELERTQEKLKNLLQEKNVLLAEVHHRVKNNLQAVISMIDMQSEVHQQDSTRVSFSKIRDRIRSMALIHEQLYLSSDFARINMYNYIQDLATSLYSTYLTDIDQISLVLNIEDILLNLDVAVPCGLVLNELLSNCLMHAFPHHQTGYIRIELILQNNEYVLTICDDGIGFPLDLDFHEMKSLGIQLVNFIVHYDLRGTIELERRLGTTIRIKFPVTR